MIYLRNFIIGACLSFIIIIILIGYRQNLFQSESLPIDDEQVGLKDQIVIHFSHVVAENTPKGLAASRFAELVHEKSKGKIIVYVHPNGVLFNDYNEVEALQNGDVQMIAPAISNMTSILSSWQIFDLPFLFKDAAQLHAALSGELSNTLLQELDSIHIKGLTFWQNGFKQIASNTPIVSMEDFNGLRIRMMASKVLKDQYSLLQAVPVTTPFTEIYSELQSDDIAAQENTISNIYSKGYYETNSQITLSNHGILAYAVMINETFWEQLDAEMQQVIIDSLAEISTWQYNSSIRLNEENLQNLENNPNVSLHKMNEKELEKWEQTVRPIYDKYTNTHKKYIKLLNSDLKGQ